MLGGWSFVGDVDGRMRDGPSGPQGGDVIARVFDVLFEDFAEVWQPSPTFGRRGEAGPSMINVVEA